MAREDDRHGRRSAEQRCARVDLFSVCGARAVGGTAPANGGIVPRGDLIVGSAGAKRIRRAATTVTMAISPLWPKPPRWPIQPGAVDPNQRWVWHTRPRFILPLWEHARAGAAQRYVRLAPTRRTARTWQLNTGAAAMRTRYGPGVSIPTTDGAEIEAVAGGNPGFAAWEQNESYTIALLIKGRSGGTGTKHLYRSGSSSTADHILFLTSGTTPNLRHQASGGGSRILGLLDVARLQRRHRPDRVLRLILDPRHGAALARRSVRLPAPLERGACAHGQCPTRHAALV
jgi:hypothetical protein